MGEQGRTAHGIWPRAAGLGAFALFCSAFLLAVGLVELVLLVALVAVAGALVAVVGWLLVRERAAIADAAVAGHRILSPAVARSARAASLLLSRALTASARTGRAAVVAGDGGVRRAVHATGPAAARARAWLQVLGAHTEERARAGIDAAAPIARRARQEAIGQLRAVGSVGSRQASRAAAVVASDLAAHRQRARAHRRKGRDLPPPSGSVGWAAARSERNERVSPAGRGSRSRRSDSGSAREGRS